MPWARVHANHACTLACVAAAAPDLRTLAGWAGRSDVADAREHERAPGCDASADREGRES